MLPDRALLNALFDASPFSVALYDTSGHLVVANASYERHWGITIADVPADWSLLNDSQLAESGLLPLITQAYQGEHVVLPPVQYDAAQATGTAGRHVWSQGHCIPVRDEHGVITHIAIVFADVSAVMEAERALVLLTETLEHRNTELSTHALVIEEERDTLDRVVSQFPAAVAVMEGPELRLRAMSRAFERMVGNRRVLGMSVRDALPSLGQEAVAIDFHALMEQVYRTGEPYTGANMLAQWDDDGDGVPEVHHVDVAFAPLRWNSGEVIGVTAMVLDMTERAMAIKALTESEIRFRTMADAAPIMLWVTDEQGNCTFVNRQWLEYTGQAEENALGKGWLAAVHPDDVEMVTRSFDLAMETHASFNADYRLRRYDDSYRWVIDSAAPRRGPAGAFLGYIGSVLDVDERARLQSSERSALAAAAQAAARARQLQQLTARLNEAATREQIADAIFGGTLSALGADAGTLAMVHLDEHQNPAYFETVRSAGYNAQTASRYRTFEVMRGRPLSDAVLDNRGLFLDNIDSWRDEYPMVSDELEAHGYKAFAVLPVYAVDRPLAAITFSFRSPQQFDEPARTFLETLSEQAALAMERQRLHESELRHNAQHAALLETIQDAFIAFDDSLCFRYVNASAEQLLRRTADVLLGRSIYEAYPGVEGTTIASEMQKALHSGRATQLEAFSHMARCWVEARIYPSPDGVSLVMQDITQRRRAQGASMFLVEATRMLTESLEYETTLRSIAEAAVPQLGDWCAVEIVADPTSGAWPPTLERLAVVHQDAEKLATGEELSREYPNDWDAPVGLPAVLRDGVPLFVPNVTAEMITTSARDARHLELLRKLQFSSIMVVPLNARGLTLGALTLCMSESGRHYDQADLALAQDLAQRAAVAVDNARLYRDAERARAEAEAANLAKSQFLATMSHELRTPLNAIQGHVQLLELGVHGDVNEAQRGALERIDRAEHHLLGLIDDVLSYARLESGRVEYDVRECRVEEVLRDVLPMVEPQFAAKGVKLSVNASDDDSRESRGAGVSDGNGRESGAVVVLADREKLGQVLLNLLTNAFKFTPPEGTVRVWVERADEEKGSTALICVSDTGIGIPQEKHEAIFQPFVQVRDAYQPGPSGTGLGLAISRDLARGMGGDLTVSSARGVGSTFTMHLRLLNPREHAEGVAAASGDNGQHAHHKELRGDVAGISGQEN